MLSGSKYQVNKKIIDFRNVDYSKFQDMPNETDYDKEFKDQNCHLRMPQANFN